MLALICVTPDASRAQVTNLDTWIDGDFDGLPDSGPSAWEINTIDSFAIYVDLTGFPTATWTNFLYFFQLGPVNNVDETTNFWDNDTADVFVRYDFGGGSFFPEDNFQHPYIYGIGGSGFNKAVTAGPERFAVVRLRSIRTTSSPGAACIIPVIDQSTYTFCQFGNGANYGLFEAGSVTPGCFTIQSTPPSPPLAITVSPVNSTLAVGLTQQFTAMGLYSDGGIFNITQLVDWSTTNPSIAAISAAGSALALEEGSVDINATLDGITGSTMLTVTPPEPATLSVSPLNASVPRAAAIQYTAMALLTDGSSADLTTEVTWSSSNTFVATIGAEGLATGLQIGVATIEAALGSLSAATNLSVTAPGLDSIAVAPADPTVPIGFTQQFTATGYYEDGSTQDLTASVVWTSSAPFVASISTTGFATTGIAGTTTIGARLGQKTASTSLTVTDAILVGIEVRPATLLIPRDATFPLEAFGLFSDGSEANLTFNAAWSSSNAGVVTVGARGLVRGIGMGNADVTANVGGVFDECAVTVVDKLRVTSPAFGDTWFVGSLDAIAWTGAYVVDAELSLDGGYSYATLFTDAPSSPLALQVPHVPTRYAKVRLTGQLDGRNYSALSDSFFVIESEIALLNFQAVAIEAGKARLTWATDPAPPKFSGFRVLRASGADDFVRLGEDLVVANEFVDESAPRGARYQLRAIDGFGDEQLLGESTLGVSNPSGQALLCYPNPAKSGAASISFSVAYDALSGAGLSLTRVAIYDVGGRLVRTLVDGALATGTQTAVWDGQDERGATVAPGVYFVQLRSGGALLESRRLVVIR